MCASLAHSDQLNPVVPDHWLGIIQSIQGFAATFEGLPKEDPSRDQIQELRSIHQTLLDQARELVEIDSYDHVSDKTLSAVFAAALNLLPRLEYATMFGQKTVDTYGSKTLPYFQVDWRGDDKQKQQLTDFSREVLEQDEAELDAIEQAVTKRLEDARDKAKVVEALRLEFGLSADDPDLRSNIKRFTNFLYPDCRLEADEIEMIVVGTAIFLIFPFKQEELETRRFQSMSSEDQQPIRQFLRRVNQFKPKQFTHFPVFGFLDGSELDSDWVEHLATQSGLTASRVRHEIARLVGILPHRDVDKFLVHDVWGHIWQAAMLDFEHMYQELGKYTDTLNWQEKAASKDGTLVFRDCFTGTGPDFQLNHEAFRRFVLSEVLERIPVAYSAVVAEMFADVVEYKFLTDNPGLKDDMANSSYFKDFPTKFDLLLQDLALYFRQATSVFRLSCEDGAHRQALREQFIEAGATAASADGALAAMKQCWQDISNGPLRAQLQWSKDADGALHTNLYTRLALNFLSVHRTIVSTLQELAKIDLTGSPLKAFYDLMLLATSVFFEEDRAQNMWHLDEYMEDRFIGLCQKLTAYLASGDSSIAKS
jgi:hypothetical protein